MYKVDRIWHEITQRAQFERGHTETKQRMSTDRHMHKHEPQKPTRSGDEIKRRDVVYSETRRLRSHRTTTLRPAAQLHLELVWRVVRPRVYRARVGQ